uniref:Uncharacterized protein n=1 Tax=Nyssomyia neivai TaxID=330878 RepID=A0A1L8D8U1_9DIPT
MESPRKDNESSVTDAKAQSVPEARVPVVEPICVKVHIPQLFNVIKAPTVCPPGQRLDQTGKCRPIF